MKKKTLCRQVLSSPTHFLAFGFGAGLAPIGPGTFGTLVAIPIYLLMQPLSLGGYLLLVALISLFGIWLCGASATKLGLKDPGGIVWDEIAGFLVTMTLAPQGWQWIAIGFVFFRIFDIWKPWPILRIDQQVEGGLGIMLDDIIAGLYALIVLQVLAYTMPNL
ncbi:MAG TPA: phosphatidylglycerophosphatase A [Thiothrix sp.]|nr:phosphatidylglycerophosphatase A [Thiothrix sp.]